MTRTLGINRSSVVELALLDPEEDEFACQEAREDFQNGCFLADNFVVVNMDSDHFTNY